LEEFDVILGTFPPAMKKMKTANRRMITIMNNDFPFPIGIASGINQQQEINID